MTYKIEKDIPIENPDFPFFDMEVGDSFWVEEDQHARCSQQMSKVHRTQDGADSPMQFTIRRRMRSGAIGYRCWRLK